MNCLIILNNMRRKNQKVKKDLTMKKIYIHKSQLIIYMKKNITKVKNICNIKYLILKIMIKSHFKKKVNI